MTRSFAWEVCDSVLSESVFFPEPVGLSSVDDSVPAVVAICVEGLAVSVFAPTSPSVV